MFPVRVFELPCEDDRTGSRCFSTGGRERGRGLGVAGTLSGAETLGFAEIFGVTCRLGVAEGFAFLPPVLTTDFTVQSFKFDATQILVTLGGRAWLSLQNSAIRLLKTAVWSCQDYETIVKSADTERSNAQHMRLEHRSC